MSWKTWGLALALACGGTHDAPLGEPPATYLCELEAGQLTFTFFANDEPALAHFQVKNEQTSAAFVATRNRVDGVASFELDDGRVLWVDGDSFGVDDEPAGRLSDCP